MRAMPASCASRPDRMPRIVDLPQPDGPRIATNEPRSAVRLKSARTSIEPRAPVRYDFDTRSRTAAASGIGHERHVVDFGGVGAKRAGRAVAPAIDVALD